MSDVIYFTLLGVGIGAFYALLASGIVVGFKGSGVINFAQGAVAMYVAFQFFYLRTKGDFHLPWFDVLPGDLNLPVKIHLTDGGLSFWPAFILAMLTAVALGVLMHFLVFRPLRNAAPLGKVIGSLGIMLYLQGVALLNFGTTNPQPKPVFPKGRWNNFLWLGRPMDKERIYLLVLAVVVGAVLWAVYRYTRFGLATRAAAGNEKGAVLLGYSPDRLALSNWVISAATAGLAGICVGTITGALVPTKFSLLIVPALGGALIGNLTSIPIAVAGGIALGMLESFTTSWLRSKHWIADDWFAGLKDAVPLIVISGVLFFRGKSLPIRGTVEEKRLPLSPYPVRVWQWTLVGVGVVALAAYVFTGSWSYALSTSLIAMMLMLSYVVITGYIGQISLVQLSLSGVAAFFLARMEANGKITDTNPFSVSGPGLPWGIAVPLAIGVAVLLGVLLGLPALRIRGVQLAVVTIAAALAIQTFYLENPILTGLRAGANAEVHPPTLFGLDLGSKGHRGLSDNPNFILFCAVVLALLCIAVANLRRGGTGRRWLAVRANERAAAAAGIDVAKTKLLASAVASAIAGVAGVMFAFQQEQVSSTSFVFFLGLAFLAFAYLGGITSINGTILGGLLAPTGLIAFFGTYHFKGLVNYTVVVGAIGLILTAILYPGGQAPNLQPMVRYAGNWLVHARGKEWLSFAKKFGPTIVIGAVLGYVIWPLRNDSFNPFWMTLLGVVLALMIRSTAMQIIRSRKGQGGHMAPPASAGSASPAAANAATVPAPPVEAAS